MDLESHLKYVDWTSKNSNYFNLDAGKEHYKLLAYLAKEVSGKSYVDIGTYLGSSAVALATNECANVITYDVCDWIPDELECSAKTKSNIDLRIMDCVNDMDEVVKSDFIVLDIDPHDGIEETRILNTLRGLNYKGFVVLDDIHLNPDMQRFWDSITEDKVDVTKYGHWSGTGIIIFDRVRFQFVLE